MGEALKPFDQLADLAYGLVSSRLKAAGWSDDDLKNAGVSKVKLFENMISWTDYYSKNLDKSINPNDFYSAAFSAISQGSVEQLVSIATLGGFGPMKALIESVHQSTLGIKPNEVTSIGHQFTDNPFGAAIIDLAGAYGNNAIGDQLSNFVGKFGEMKKFLASTAYNAWANAVDPAKVGAGRSPIVNSVKNALAPPPFDPNAYNIGPEAQKEQLHDMQGRD